MQRGPGGRKATRTCLVLVTLVGLLALSTPAVAKPQPGDLDRSFSSNGVALTAIPPGNSHAQAVAIGRKRRIVVAGYNGKGFALARYMPNGQLDPSFAGDGRRSYAFSGFQAMQAIGTDVAIGQKGAIVVAGRACVGIHCSFAVERLTSGGAQDRSFGRDGQVTLAFPGDAYSAASAVAIDPQGRVLVAGTTCPDKVTFGCKFALARLDQHGRPDPTFGDDGRVVTPFTTQGGDLIYSAATGMAINSRGRIVLAGNAGPSIALACYKPNGDLVRGFGDGGTVDRHMGSFGDVAGIAINRQDKIVAAGSSYSVARFHKDGRLDRSFGKGGRTSAQVSNGHAKAFAMAIDSRHRIVVSGLPHIVVRYRPNGQLSKSFGRKGIARTKASPGEAYGLAIDSHNRPVIAGSAHRRRTRSVFAVARLLG
jgi:uncharacterized delta-60 repeat protein